MAPVIFGLNLGEFTWGKFGNKNMWNKMYHLRRTKFIIYQCALIFCVLSESLGTASLSDYISQQKALKRADNKAYIFNNDYVGAASYNIFAGVFVAFVFGAAYFFDLIWPERHEDRGIRIAWKCCAVAATVFYLAAALTLTIITATHSAYFTGIETARGKELLTKTKTNPLTYKDNPRAIAAVVFSWLGFASTFASMVILIIGKIHDEKYGPWSTHERPAHSTAEDPEARVMEMGNGMSEKPEIARPPPVGWPTNQRLEHMARGTDTTTTDQAAVVSAQDEAKPVSAV